MISGAPPKPDATTKAAPSVFQEAVFEEPEHITCPEPLPLVDEELNPEGSGIFAGLRYRPIVKLGRGGTAEVFLAAFRGPAGFSKLVVVKALRSDLAGDPEMRGEFLREARLCAQLNHPNVVQVHDVIERPNAVILVMEYLEGQTLAAVPRATGQLLPMAMQLEVLVDVLAGLHYSHELRGFDGSPLNLVHRDVSPQNVFISCDGVVKVLDFGVAKVSSADRTRTGIIKGKIRYMAPEQLVGDPIDRRADIYAVGCMLWEAAAGQRMWGTSHDRDVVRGLVHGHIPAPSEVAHVEPRLERIILRAVAHKPADRYSSALELQQELEAYIFDKGMSVTRQAIGAHVQQLFAHELESRRRRLAAVVGTARDSGSGDLLQLDDSSHRPRLSDPGSSTTETVNLAQRPDLAHLAAGRPRWRGLIATLAVITALGSVSLAWIRLQPRPVVTQPDSASNTAPGAPASSISLLIQAHPAQASITLDALPLKGNPAFARVKADAMEHTIEISAEGYDPEKRRVRFDKDLETTIILRPSAAAARPSASPQSGPPALAPVARPARVPRPRPAARAPTTVASEHAAAPRAPGPDCVPPYRIVDGVKTYKPECL